MNVTVRGKTRPYRTVTFDAPRNHVRLIEQRLLPHEFKIVATRTFRETAAAIRDMIVRGAGAIGATAAYGLAQGARAFRGSDRRKFSRHVETVYTTLKDARPTAVDPVNAMNAIRRAMARGKSVEEQQAIALAAAEEFANEDVRHCAADRTARREVDSQRHERADALQRGLAGVRGHRHVQRRRCTQPRRRGKSFTSSATKPGPVRKARRSRPGNLRNKASPHQIIADNAAGHLMQRGEIDLVIVGSDRTLGRTGEVANKIGTYTKAVLAQAARDSVLRGHSAFDD